LNFFRDTFLYSYNPGYAQTGFVPYGVTTGPDDILWFCKFGGGRIGRITTYGHVMHFAPPSPALVVVIETARMLPIEGVSAGKA